jgi:hypothetical protein
MGNLVKPAQHSRILVYMFIPTLLVISIFNTSPAKPQAAPEAEGAEDVFALALFVLIKFCKSTTCPCILLTKPASDSNWSRCDSVIVCAITLGATDKTKPAHTRKPHTSAIKRIFIVNYNFYISTIVWQKHCF